jgi:shikimate kinase
MRIFLGGVGCVGKTTTAAELASLLGWRFFDLDAQIEKHYGTSIERLQKRYFRPTGFRGAAAKALKHLLADEANCDCVIALPPAGLKDSYWRVLCTVEDAKIVILHDAPESILKRITFYDEDSRPIKKDLTEEDLQYYLDEIRLDIKHFRHSFKKAHLTVNMAGCSPPEVARKIKDALMLRMALKSARS